MKNWDDLKIVLALSRYKTMTASAQALGMNTTTVSRRLERLTEEIGSTLFVWRGTVWEPTSRAKPLIELAEQLDADVDQTSNQDDEGVPASRKLRISISLQILVSVATPHLAEFMLNNPELEIEIYHEERSVAFGEVDLLVGFNQPTEGRLVRTQLGEMGFCVFFNKKWENGPTGHIKLGQQDAVQTPCMSYLEKNFGAPRLRTPGLYFVLSVMKTLPLATCLPINLGESNPELVPLEAGAPTQDNFFPVWASYHESRRLDPDIRLGIEFLRKCFSN